MLNVATFELNRDRAEKRGWDPDELPHTVYVMTYDDGSCRILRRGAIRTWDIYKSFDDAAPRIQDATKDNLYKLRSHDADPDPWEHWEDDYMLVRYDLTAYSQKQRNKIVSDDLWRKHGKLMMKDHYAYKLPIFDDALA